jgi:pimeloyl-ACP methyl ester carboxylesterase/DNA-binding CsgD family transcriptional regulator
MTELDRHKISAQIAERDHKAEIVDRLYDVALDPIRLEELLEVWEGRIGPMRIGLVEQAITLDDPEIDAHVGRATVFLDRMEATREDGGYRSVLEEVPRFAAFLGDGGPLITACNRAAQTAFAITDGGPMTGLPFDPEDVALLRGEMRRVASGRGAKIETLRIRSLVTGSPVIVRLSRVENAAGPPLCLALSTELAWPDGFEVTVAEAFGLTLAEVEIVRGMALGQPLKDIAAARSRSVETVRTQLRSILAKTETHSQSELVRVVLGLMDVSLLPSGGVAVASQATGLEDRPFRQMTLPDGRHLEWIEFGDPKGRAVLYMHLDYGLIRWPAKAERAAQQRRLRVIVPVRAGYGGSDLLGRNVDHTDGVTADYAAVLDHLGVRRAAILCLGADLRFAMNLANQRPGMISGILGCAAQLPLRSAAQYERMDKWQRFILANARYAPKVLPFLVQAGFSLARRLGKEAFFRQVNGGSPADMETFARADVREAILLGSEVNLGAAKSAHQAFARECIGSEKDWSAIVKAVTVPALLLQGDQDPQTPVLTVRELMQDYPHLKVEFLPQTGQLLFFREWPLVLERLEEFLPA